MLSWQLGLKANALYRDGSKLSQPLDLDASTTTTTRGRGRGDRRAARRGAARADGRRADRRAHRRAGHDRASAAACRTAARATRRRPSSAATRSTCAPASTRTARSARSSSTCTRKAPPSAADEQLRHRDLDRPAVRRAARGVRRGLHLHALRAERHRSQGNDTIKMATSIIDYIFRELAISYLGRDDLAHVAQDDLEPDTVGKGEDASACRRRARPPRPPPSTRSRTRSRRSPRPASCASASRCCRAGTRAAPRRWR